MTGIRSRGPDQNSGLGHDTNIEGSSAAPAPSPVPVSQTHSPRNRRVSHRPSIFASLGRRGWARLPSESSASNLPPDDGEERATSNSGEEDQQLQPARAAGEDDHRGVSRVGERSSQEVGAGALGSDLATPPGADHAENRLVPQRQVSREPATLHGGQQPTEPPQTAAVSDTASGSPAPAADLEVCARDSHAIELGGVVISTSFVQVHGQSPGLSSTARADIVGGRVRPDLNFGVPPERFGLEPGSGSGAARHVLRVPSAGARSGEPTTYVLT
mmetsp:Transcript_31912/g.66064  ORF Transcript_31912/g.66064 Transcript_31912/m.66064 type:complete len:273 (+) Transcript_31912:650-1468(+)